MNHTATRIESEHVVARVHVVARAGIRSPDASSRRVIAGTFVRRELWVGEVPALVIVVADAQFFQLGEVNV